MSKQIANIRLALGSIIYAPLYVAKKLADEDSRANICFRFLAPHDDIQIKLQPHNARNAFSPIDRDPTFSPVIDRRYFQAYPQDWFAIGDPLRVVRMLETNPTHIQRSFGGCLVSKLAFWVIGPGDNQTRKARGHAYNYVTCHMKGMTGYHLAEQLFDVNGAFNPLAPSQPGEEVSRFWGVFNEDAKRRSKFRKSDGDPVVIASLSTELHEILYYLREDEDRRRAADGLIFDSVMQYFPKGRLPAETEEFVMTAIVARKDPKRQADIDDATQRLREKIFDAVTMLREDPQEFWKLLRACCNAHAQMFADIGLQLKGFKDESLREIYDGLRDIYPDNEKLLASTIAKHHTDSWLKSCLASDIRRSPRKRKLLSTLVDESFQTLKTDNWDGSGSLWP